MTERLEIDALRALLAIASLGGVTRAAENLALSQSAVSHKIRRLERTLDCDLLTRRAGGPLFTDAGQRLCDYAQRIIDLHDEALHALSKRSLEGTIRLGMTEDTTTSGIARILGRFTRLYPDVRVKTRTSQSLNVQAWLNAGELDVAVMQVFSTDVQKGDLVLFHDSLHWVKSRDLTLDLSLPTPFLSFDRNCFFKHWGFGDGQLEGCSFDNVLECPSAAGVQSAVASGLGVALLNKQHITRDIEIIEGVFPNPPDITYVARTNLRRRNPAAKALIGVISEEIQTAAPMRVDT